MPRFRTDFRVHLREYPTSCSPVNTEDEPAGRTFDIRSIPPDDFREKVCCFTAGRMPARTGSMIKKGGSRHAELHRVRGQEAAERRAVLILGAGHLDNPVRSFCVETNGSDRLSRGWNAATLRAASDVLGKIRRAFAQIQGDSGGCSHVRTERDRDRHLSRTRRDVS